LLRILLGQSLAVLGRFLVGARIGGELVEGVLVQIGQRAFPAQSARARNLAIAVHAQDGPIRAVLTRQPGQPRHHGLAEDRGHYHAVGALPQRLQFGSLQIGDLTRRS